MIHPCGSRSSSRWAARTTSAIRSARWTSVRSADRVGWPPMRPTLLFLLSLFVFVSCKENPHGGGGVVAQNDAAAATPAEAAAPPPVDPTKCPGCQLVPQPSWTFEGIYSDPACT